MAPRSNGHLPPHHRDPTTARLFLAAAILWPLCLWALFNASAPTPDPQHLLLLERNTKNNNTAASLRLSFRNVLDRVDVVGYGPTHPRIAAVVTGTDAKLVQRTVDSVMAHTTLDRVFSVVAVVAASDDTDQNRIETQIVGSHPPHKVHVLVGSVTQQDAVSFVQILSASHEKEGLKSPQEDLILVLLQSGTQFTVRRMRMDRCNGLRIGD